MIAFIADGQTAKDIARTMTVSPRAVERHLESCRQKLRAANNAHMVTVAVAEGHLLS